MEMAPHHKLNGSWFDNNSRMKFIFHRFILFKVLAKSSPTKVLESFFLFFGTPNREWTFLSLYSIINIALLKNLSPFPKNKVQEMLILYHQ
jgi:hypothetical protein